MLGQKRSWYEQLRAKGVAEDKITERMTEDADLFGVTLENYKTMLAELKSRGSKGEDIEEKRKQHTVKIADGALKWLGYQNGLLTADIDKLNYPSLKKFVKDMQVATKEIVALLQNTDFTTKRGKQAWMFMIHAPVYNFLTDDPTGTNLLSPFVGGWSDKSRSYDQYGIRQEASGSATFFRPISYEQPITAPEIITPKPQKKHH